MPEFRAATKAYYAAMETMAIDYSRRRTPFDPAQAIDGSERRARNVMSELSAEQTRLAQLWEEHMRHEFQTCSTEDTLATMVEDSYVNHVPVMTGGVGHAELRQFYARHFIPKMPPDMEMMPLSRTIGTDQLVDEMVVRFTHTVEMDWMLPGIAPSSEYWSCCFAASSPMFLAPRQRTINGKMLRRVRRPPNWALANAGGGRTPACTI
jgi:hypothetical protein